MRKVILGLAVSLDGFIEGPKGEYDWCFTDQDYGLSSFFERVDALFMGRKSYELTQQMAAQGSADQSSMPAMKSYVFSNTLTEVGEDGEIVSGDILARVKEIKSSPGKDIWLFGGAALTSSLMNLGLVDELWLSIHPVLLGAGKPLFQNLDHRIQLTLTSSKTYETGLVSVTYQVQ